MLCIMVRQLKAYSFFFLSCPQGMTCLHQEGLAIRVLLSIRSHFTFYMLFELLETLLVIHLVAKTMNSIVSYQPTG